MAFNQHRTKVSMVGSHKTKGRKRQGLVGWGKGEVHKMGQLPSWLSASATQMCLYLLQPTQQMDLIISTPDLGWSLDLVFWPQLAV